MHKCNVFVYYQVVLLLGNVITTLKEIVKEKDNILEEKCHNIGARKKLLVL